MPALSAGCVFEQVVSSDIMLATENGVFTNDNRYFAVGILADSESDTESSYIIEVKKRTDGSNDCILDGNFNICKIAKGEIEGEPCFFGGLTTDGADLYASCTVFNPLEPNAILMKVGLNSDSSQNSVQLFQYDVPRHYNGMAIHDGNLYMSSPGLDGSAIVQLPLDSTLNSATNFISPETWLEADNNVTYGSNGIQIEENTMYYAGGNLANGILYKLPITADPTLADLEPIYSCPFGRIIDDFVILADYIALGEVPITAFMKTGNGNLVFVPKNNDNPLFSIITGSDMYISSLAYDEEGAVFSPNALIATDVFHGGIWELQ